MSVKQSTRSNSSIPSTDPKDRISITADNATVKISPKQIVSTIALTVISVSMIVMGSMYLKRCPNGRYIPVYLLVGGIMGLLKPLSSLRSGSHTVDPSDQTVLRQALMANSSKSSSLINCFMLCWFFIGSYWINSIYKPVFGRDCDKTLYLFAFWLVTSVYLTVAVVFGIIVIIFFIKIFMFCIAKLRPTRSTETPADV